MKLTYWGHSCFLIETASHRVVIDPFLTGNPRAAVKAEEVKCDFVLITHGHADHIGDALQIAKDNDALIISTYELASYLAQKGAKTHPMGIGGARDFPFGRVKWTIAHHSSGYDTPEGCVYMGNPAGVVVTAENQSVYHAGDTSLFLDMQLIGEQHDLDVALLPIGDNFTMGVEDAVRAIEFLSPKVTIPMHYKTFDVIDVDPESFARQAAAMGGRIVKVLDPGQTYEVV